MDASPPYLADAFLAESASFTGLEAEPAAAVRAAGAAVRGSAELTNEVRRAHEAIFGPEARERKFEREEPALGEHAGMLPVLVLLSGLPAARALWDERGVPLAVQVQTLSDLGLWMRHYRARKGRWGMKEFRWLWYHLTGRLYRLGRVQFMAGEFPGDVHVYRRRDSGEVALLARDGLTLRADGFLDGANRREDPAGRWTARLECWDGVTRGHRCAADGHVLKAAGEFPEREWEEVLKPKDPVLDMHIPAEEPLRAEDVVESCRRATAFFPRHFPERPFKAIACWAWLLDPTYQRILPPTSNLPRFQALFHLYPVLEYDDKAFIRVWGEPEPELARVPRDTTLRRALADLYAAGGSLIGAGGGIWRGLLP